MENLEIQDLDTVLVIKEVDNWLATRAGRNPPLACYSSLEFCLKLVFPNYNNTYDM